MSDNEFNHRSEGEKDPLEADRDSATPIVSQNASEQNQSDDLRAEQNVPDALPDDKVDGSRDVSSSSPEQTSAPYGEPQQSPPSYGQPQQPYQNPQNPYSPYGQYNHPYGQYQNPYGNYNNPQAGNSQNQYNQQPYWSYQQYSGPYQQNNPQQNPQQAKPPKKKNTGFRVFMWILGILIVAFVVGFSGYGIYTAMLQRETLPDTSSLQPGEESSSTPGSSASSAAESQSGTQGSTEGSGTNTNVTRITIQQQPSGNELNAKQVYKKVVESVVGVETMVAGAPDAQSGLIQGTGIVATSNGYVLTNAHVVNYSRANKVKIILHDKKEYDAKVVGYDKTSDIAVLKVQADNLSAAVFGNSEQLEIGDSVIAIGNPGGMSYSSSLTGGYVSALNRAIEAHSDNGMTYIQTDAAINPGNSGGPLVNMYGQVVGINSNKIVATGYEGMGFAIPMVKAKTIIDDLVANGYVSGRSRLGIKASEVTQVQSQLSGYPVGVMILSISAESDLKKSNVAVRDIITKADGQTIATMEDLYAVLNKHKAGETITLTIYSMSSGETKQVQTKLLEDKGETQTK
jgi:serine protease Do